jgi:hypothetical protein
MVEIIAALQFVCVCVSAVASVLYLSSEVTIARKIKEGEKNV